MSIFEQIENPDLEDLRCLAARLLEDAQNNGCGVTTYVYKDDMLDEIIACFYGKECLSKLQYN